MLEVGPAAASRSPARRRRSGCRRATRASLPFEDGQFDALTFTYLLRYVEDPAATLRELARVVKPGGTIAGLEFGVPRGIWRPLWELWVRVGLPTAGRVIGDGWHEVGAFLGPSIRGHYEEWPLPRLLAGVARRGDRRRAGEAAEPRRRDRDVGTTGRGKAGVLRAASAAAGATT